MADGISDRFAAALAIRDSGRVSFASAASAAAISPHQFAVGRILSLKRRQPESRAVIGTLTGVWDLGSRIRMRQQGERYILRFDRQEDLKYVLTGGPWFFGRSLFITAEYDGFCDPSTVPIDSFSVWVDVFGLPPKLLTDEAVAMVGETLGQVEHLDRLGIRRGKRARVRILHRICDPVKEAYPPMQFEFCSAGVTVSLTFKYERTVWYCRVCGLLEHPVAGCRGPPDMSAVQVIGASSVKVSGRGSGVTVGSSSGGGSSSGSKLTSNPNLGRGAGFLEAAAPAMSGFIPRPIVPSVGALFQCSPRPTFSFSLPGVSAAELATQAARFRTPIVPLQLEPPTQASVPLPPPVHTEALSGVKRGADCGLASTGKRSKALSPLLEVVPFELSFEPEMALAIVDGKIKVSPVKKRIGRPPGSKNKSKGEVGESSGSTGPHRRQKKKYKARKAMVMDNAEVGPLVEGSFSDSAAGAGSYSVDLPAPPE